METNAIGLDNVVEQGSSFYRRRWYAMLILSLSLVLVIMDGTIVNVAIPSIVADFDASFRDAEWVNTIYSLVYAATLILWGKIGDQYGRRLLFLIGVSLFGLGSALVGVSSSIEMLVTMRALQGIGAAILSPSTLSIITTTFKGRERGIAFGIWGASAGVAAALGPLLGGWVIDHGSWRWAFYINVPVVFAAFIGSLWAIRESRSLQTDRYFDFFGTLLGGLGLAAVVFGIIEAQAYGWWKPDAQFTFLGWNWPSNELSIVPVAIAIGTVLLVIFTWFELFLENRAKEPLFEFRLLKYGGFRYGMVTGLIVNLGELGVLFALSLFLQGTKGLSAFETGIALLPLAIAAFFGAPLAGAFSSRIGPKWIVLTGMVIETAAMFILSQVVTPDVSVNTVALILALYGLGLGLAIAQLTNLVLYDIPGPKAGIASGANSTIRQVGAALGIAIIGTVLTTTIEDTAQARFDDSDVLSAEHMAYAQVGFLEIAKQPIYFEVPDLERTLISEFEQQMAGQMDPEQAEAIAQMAAKSAAPELVPIFNDARSDGMANAALWACIFIAVGAITAFRLPNPKEEPATDTPGVSDEVPAAA
jgi:EmrB/QacA subfamily drug resistance transporter